MQWLEKFFEKLGNLLNGPPYLVFLFISSTLLIVSLVTNRFIDQVLIIFIYSVVGTIWRHFIRDIRDNTFVKNFLLKDALTIFYHIINLMLAFYLLNFLEII